MEEKQILEIKHSDRENFVGIRIENNIPKIYFPIGYDIEEYKINLNSKNYYEKVKKIKRDIILLMNSLKQCLNKNDGKEVENYDYYKNDIFFPFFTCLDLLKNYIENGYYQENENVYVKSHSGKINWNKTIKQVTPLVQTNSFVYTNFIVRKSKGNLNSTIRLIHKYCIYECNRIIGFLFGNIKLEKPEIEFNKKMFLQILREKLNETFNDDKKQIIINMIRFISGLDESNPNGKILEYGTNNYQMVWEKMIDIMFKERDKKKFYPSGKLNINHVETKTSNLRMDSIYINTHRILIVDAKYYKFGISPNPEESLLNNDQYNLPAFSDINKQISYAEYVEYKYKKDGTLFYPLKENLDISKIIKNVFILPYNKSKNSFPNNNADIIHYIGYAEADWKNEKLESEKSYNKVHIFLIDTKWLIEKYNFIESEEIDAKIKEMEIIIDNYISSQKIKQD